MPAFLSRGSSAQERGAAVGGDPAVRHWPRPTRATGDPGTPGDHGNGSCRALLPPLPRHHTYLNAYVYTARRDRSAACVGSRSGARWCGPRSGSGRGRAASQTARLTAAEVARPVTPPAFAAEVRVRGGGAARRPGVASSAPKWRRSPASLRKCPGGQRLRRPAAPAPEPIPSPPEERRCPRRPPGQRREPKPPASSPPKFARRLWPARRAARAAAGPDRGGRAQDRHAPGGLPAQRAVQPASRRYRAPGGRRLRGNARCSGRP